MRATKKEEQLMMDIYRRMYSEIGVDLDELIEQGVTKEIGWYNSYFLNIPYNEETKTCEYLWTRQ